MKIIIKKNRYLTWAHMGERHKNCSRDALSDSNFT